MPTQWLILGGILAGCLALAWFVRRWLLAQFPAWRKQQAREHFTQARAKFSREREHLEARFFDRAAKSNKPRGLKWERVDFGNTVLYAQVLQGAEFAALVPCTIGFSAIPGGGMEEVEAVSQLRSACALFLYDGQEWRAEGRVLFNLSCEQALVHLAPQLAPLGWPVDADSKSG